MQAENVGLHVIRRTGVSQKLETLANLVASKKINLDIEETVSWRDAERLVDELKTGAPARRVTLLID